jgi:hypothetical protein
MRVLAVEVELSTVTIWIEDDILRYVSWIRGVQGRIEKMAINQYAN